MKIQKTGKGGYIRRLNHQNEFVLILLKFITNFNESLLSAEIVQSFYKCIGVNIWSSTLIWASTPILMLALAPTYKAFFLNNKYNTFLLSLGSLAIMTFLNSLGFIVLFTLETISAVQSHNSILLILLGYLSFMFIDVSKMIYEYQVFNYMLDYLHDARKKKFQYLGIIAEVLGRIAGALICALYILLGKTTQDRFSGAFYTNMQFSYYVAACLNVAAIFAIFIFWPKHFNVHYPGEIAKPANLAETYFQGLIRVPKLNAVNKSLLLRLFLNTGAYMQVAVSLTQWASNKFLIDFPDVLSNSPMQAIDVGTAWGSIGLAIFYACWGLTRIVIFPFRKMLIAHSRKFSRWQYLYGVLMYGMSAVFYNYDIRTMIIVWGLSGLAYDALITHKIKKRLRADASMEDLTEIERNYIVDRIMEQVSFMGEFTFFIILPAALDGTPDWYWMILVATIYFLMAVTIPFDKKYNI
jgi:hypothetical protein